MENNQILNLEKFRELNGINETLISDLAKLFVPKMEMQIKQITEHLQNSSIKEISPMHIICTQAALILERKFYQLFVTN